MEDDTISWQEFVHDPSVAPNTRRIRKMVIDRLAKANGFESPTLLLDKIRIDKDKPNTDSEKLTPYRAARKYVFGLIAPEQENGWYSPSPFIGDIPSEHMDRINNM